MTMLKIWSCSLLEEENFSTLLKSWNSKTIKSITMQNTVQITAASMGTGSVVTHAPRRNINMRPSVSFFTQNHFNVFHLKDNLHPLCKLISFLSAYLCLQRRVMVTKAIAAPHSMRPVEEHSRGMYSGITLKQIPCP